MQPDTSNGCPCWTSKPHFLKELPRVETREDASSRHMPEWEFRKSGQNSFLEYFFQKVIEIFVQKNWSCSTLTSQILISRDERQFCRRVIAGWGKKLILLILGVALYIFYTLYSSYIKLYLSFCEECMLAALWAGLKFINPLVCSWSFFRFFRVWITVSQHCTDLLARILFLLLILIITITTIFINFTWVIKGLATSLWTSSSKRSRQASMRKAKGGNRWWTLVMSKVNIKSVLLGNEKQCELKTWFQ